MESSIDLTPQLARLRALAQRMRDSAAANVNSGTDHSLAWARDSDAVAIETALKFIARYSSLESEDTPDADYSDDIEEEEEDGVDTRFCPTCGV